MDRAYSVLTIKSVDEEARVIEGIATTPETDRQGDIVEPSGAKFALPLPLLWQHDSSQPIGHVEAADKTKDGIRIRARIAKDVLPRIEDCWAMIKAGLVRGLSIGFRGIDVEEIKGTFGLRFKTYELLEISAVTIPANAQASIHSIKQFDTDQPAASGHALCRHVDPTPGDSGTPAKPAKRGFFFDPNQGKSMKTIQEQVAALEAARQAKAARMSEIMQKSIDEGRSTDDEEREEFDTLESEVKMADGDLARLRQLEKMNVAAAKPVQGQTEKQGSESRAPSVLSVRRNIEKGTAFTRYAMALAAGRGSVSDALKYVEQRRHWMDETPEVAQYIKAGPGTTTGENWAAPLVNETNLAAEFIDLLRPATVLGRIAGVRNVPFNVRIPVQTGGSTVNWVGESAPKPVSDLAFDAITLGMNKVAGIVVLTDELVRSSSPSAEAAVRNDLVSQIARFLDQQFIDPTVAATANSPASITNGVTPIAASGTEAESLYWDLNSALAAFDDTDMGVAGITIVTRPGTARGISSLRNALGQFEFGGLSMAGGSLGGFNVITSNSVPSGAIVLIKGDEILLADDGQTVLDASREATLDMNGGTTPNFNLFQRNAVAIRAERYMTWRKRRDGAVAIITGASYGPAAPEPLP